MSGNTNKKKRTTWEEIKEALRPDHLEYLLNRHLDLLMEEVELVKQALFTGEAKDVRKALNGMRDMRSYYYDKKWRKREVQELDERYEEERRKRREARQARKEAGSLREVKIEPSILDDILPYISADAPGKEGENA